jgi:HNH endonuclease.
MSLSSSRGKNRTSNRCRQLLRNQEHPTCYLCGREDELEVHHLNWHHEDDTPSNLVVVCQPCHKELHKVGYLSLDELNGIRDKVRAERTPGEVAVSRRRQEGSCSVITAVVGKRGQLPASSFLLPELDKLEPKIEAGEASYLFGGVEWTS